MHTRARARLAIYLDRVTFIEQSFKDSDCYKPLGYFDFVVTNQVVHEVRHKRHVEALHEQVRNVLALRGKYLVCDHYTGEGGMVSSDLHMTVKEQWHALVSARYKSIIELNRIGGSVLHVTGLTPGSTSAWSLARKYPPQRGRTLVWPKTL